MRKIVPCGTVYFNIVFFRRSSYDLGVAALLCFLPPSRASLFWCSDVITRMLLPGCYYSDCFGDGVRSNLHASKIAARILLAVANEVYRLKQSVEHLSEGAFLRQKYILRDVKCSDAMQYQDWCCIWLFFILLKDTNYA